jgi:glucuronate isomerase
MSSSKSTPPHQASRFINDDFLLGSDSARRLYHEHAKDQPIIDFHNHLSPAQIAGNHCFGNLQEAWLAEDHYKWRAMRANGIPESHITGSASPEEKFQAWASTVPRTLRNPLYQWTHLELARYFGITIPLNSETAPEIWQETKERLSTLRVHDMLAMQRVQVLCTTDDPADTLDHHETIRRSVLPTRVYPTFRPDRAFQISDPVAFRTWMTKLETASSCKVATLDDLLTALKQRHDAFHDLGCRLSDHSFPNAPQATGSQSVAEEIFARALAGEKCTQEEQDLYTATVMHEIGRWNAARGWTMQLHLGALRNNSSRLMRSFGADAGCDSIGDRLQAKALSAFLDSLDRTDELPKTILYNLNPSDNHIFAAMAGNFQNGSLPGKIQHGSAWWFLDQKEGIETQLNTLSNLGLLSRFVGMVTDSRSFLSFPRHEYFRRVLCNLLGSDMERGEIPLDDALVGSLVRDICSGNASSYFGFPQGE